MKFKVYEVQYLKTFKSSFIQMKMKWKCWCDEQIKCSNGNAKIIQFKFFPFFLFCIELFDVCL